jgi:hypothetical protein
MDGPTFTKHDNIFSLCDRQGRDPSHHSVEDGTASGRLNAVGDARRDNYLRAKPDEESPTFKRIRQARRHELWRVAHPYDPDIAVRIICWFPMPTCVSWTIRRTDRDGDSPGMHHRHPETGRCRVHRVRRDFYAVNHSFVSRIDAELSKISLSRLRYLRYAGETEPDYNMAAARDHPDDFVLLDRALIKLPDEHGVEAADLVCSSGALIHVKAQGKIIGPEPPVPAGRQQLRASTSVDAGVAAAISSDTRARSQRSGYRVHRSCSHSRPETRVRARGDLRRPSRLERENHHEPAPLL